MPSAFFCPRDKLGRADIASTFARLPTAFASAPADSSPKPSPAARASLELWRPRGRCAIRQVGVLLCLNCGTPPPDRDDVPSPSAERRVGGEEAWVDVGARGAPAGDVSEPLADARIPLSPQAATERVARRLALQYERLQPKARVRVAPDPSRDKVQRLAASLRRHAQKSGLKAAGAGAGAGASDPGRIFSDATSTDSERVLVHYNGHGVPRPTVNGELWSFNEAYTAYVPIAASELLSWTGTPAMFVLDCDNAGRLLPVLEAATKTAGTASPEQLNTNSANLPDPSCFDTTIVDPVLVLGATSSNQSIPLILGFPADIFTACLMTPIKASLRLEMHSHGGISSVLASLPPAFRDMLSDADEISLPGRISDKRSLLGELQWLLTTVTDAIAWASLPRALFFRLFRQDILCATLFRNFLLADRTLRRAGVSPVSLPRLPETHEHPLWSHWDAALYRAVGLLPIALGFGWNDVQRLESLVLSPDIAGAVKFSAVASESAITLSGDKSGYKSIEQISRGDGETCKIDIGVVCESWGTDAPESESERNSYTSSTMPQTTPCLADSASFLLDILSRPVASSASATAAQRVSLLRARLALAMSPVGRQICYSIQFLTEGLIVTPFFSDCVSGFKQWLSLSACSSPTLHAPSELPVLLQLILTKDFRMEAMHLLANFVSIGPEAVNLALLMGLNQYLVKLLEADVAELRVPLICTWACVLSVDNSLSTALELVQKAGALRILSTFLSQGRDMNRSEDEAEALPFSVTEDILSRSCAIYLIWRLVMLLRDSHVVAANISMIREVAISVLERAHISGLGEERQSEVAWALVIVGELDSWKNFSASTFFDGTSDRLTIRALSSGNAMVRQSALSALSQAFASLERSSNECLTSFEREEAALFSEASSFHNNLQNVSPNLLPHSISVAQRAVDDFFSNTSGDFCVAAFALAALQEPYASAITLTLYQQRCTQHRPLAQSNSGLESPQVTFSSDNVFLVEKSSEIETGAPPLSVLEAALTSHAVTALSAPNTLHEKHDKVSLAPALREACAAVIIAKFSLADMLPDVRLKGLEALRFFCLQGHAAHGFACVVALSALLLEAATIEVPVSDCVPQIFPHEVEAPILPNDDHFENKVTHDAQSPPPSERVKARPQPGFMGRRVTASTVPSRTDRRTVTPFPDESSTSNTPSTATLKCCSSAGLFSVSQLSALIVSASSSFSSAIGKPSNFAFSLSSSNSTPFTRAVVGALGPCGQLYGSILQSLCRLAESDPVPRVSDAAQQLIADLTLRAAHCSVLVAAGVTDLGSSLLLIRASPSRIVFSFEGLLASDLFSQLKAQHGSVSSSASAHLSSLSDVASRQVTPTRSCVTVLLAKGSALALGALDPLTSAQLRNDAIRACDDSDHIVGNSAPVSNSLLGGARLSAPLVARADPSEEERARSALSSKFDIRQSISISSFSIPPSPSNSFAATFQATALLFHPFRDYLITSVRDGFFLNHVRDDRFNSPPEFLPASSYFYSETEHSTTNPPGSSFHTPFPFIVNSIDATRLSQSLAPHGLQISQQQNSTSSPLNQYVSPRTLDDTSFLTWVDEHAGCHLLAASARGAVRIYSGSDVEACPDERNQNHSPRLLNGFLALPEHASTSSKNAPSAVYTYAPSTCSLISGGSAKYLRVWDLAASACVRLLPLPPASHPAELQTTCIASAWPGTHIILAGTSGGAVHVLDSRISGSKSAVVRTFDEHSSRVVGLALSRVGSCHAVASGGSAGDVRLWDLRVSRSLRVVRTAEKGGSLESLVAHDFAPIIAAQVRRPLGKTGSSTQEQRSSLISILSNSGDRVDSLAIDSSGKQTTLTLPSPLAWHPSRILLASGSGNGIVQIAGPHY